MGQEFRVVKKGEGEAKNAARDDRYRYVLTTREFKPRRFKI